MKKTQRDVPPHSKTLVEEKTDFTAEGSPPPGKVVGSVPPIKVGDVPVAKAKQRKQLVAEKP